MYSLCGKRHQNHFLVVLSTLISYLQMYVKSETVIAHTIRKILVNFDNKCLHVDILSLFTSNNRDNQHSTNQKFHEFFWIWNKFNFMLARICSSDKLRQFNMVEKPWRIVQIQKKRLHVAPPFYLLYLFLGMHWNF